MSVNFEFNQDDLDALDHSIEKRWRLIVELGGGWAEWEDLGIPGCELCELDSRREGWSKTSIIYKETVGPDCKMCVIYKDTESLQCMNTPYLKAARGVKQAQRDMLAYLEDLRERMTK